MRFAKSQAGEIVRRRLGGVNIGVKGIVGGDMPNFSVVALVHGEQTQQCKSGLELKDEKISRLKILRHMDEISIRTRLLIKSGYMKSNLDKQAMLDIAIEEARIGLAEGGIPIGAALFDGEGNLLGRGHNRRVQENDPSIHGETDAFRKAGRQRSYRDCVMVTTLAPCWYCSGLVRQFGIGTVVLGESLTFRGGIDWLREHGVGVIDMQSHECIEMLGGFISRHPEIWNEDIGED